MLNGTRPNLIIMDEIAGEDSDMDDNNELVILNDTDVPVTTSLLVAENFDREHKEVMKSIRVIKDVLERNEIAGGNFSLGSYFDANNQERPMYEMDRNAYSQLVGSFKGEKATLFRKKYADAFDAMEAELMKPKETVQFEIPKTYAEAMQLGADQALQLEIQAPKVKAYDDLMDSTGSVKLRDAGKILGVAPHNFLEWLREEGDLYYLNRRNTASQRRLRQGIFETKAVSYFHKPKNTHTFNKDTFVTAKGIDFYKRKLDAGEIPDWVHMKVTK